MYLDPDLHSHAMAHTWSLSPVQTQCHVHIYIVTIKKKYKINEEGWG